MRKQKDILSPSLTDSVLATQLERSITAHYVNARIGSNRHAHHKLVTMVGVRTVIGRMGDHISSLAAAVDGFEAAERCAGHVGEAVAVGARALGVEAYVHSVSFAVLPLPLNDLGKSDEVGRRRRGEQRCQVDDQDCKHVGLISGAGSQLEGNMIVLSLGGRTHDRSGKC